MALHRIVEPLRTGELRLGDRLPSERKLAIESGLSRSTIRKALSLLIEAGVLEPVPGQGSERGLVVKSNVLPPGLLAGGFEPLSLAEISGVLEARRMLEPRVAQLAAVVATDDDFSRLEEMLQEQLAANDPFLLRRLDAQFHLLIAAATQNHTVMVMMHALYERLELTRSPSLQPGEAQKTLALHRRTLDALKTRDPHLVAAVMDEHLALNEAAWERETGRRLRYKTAPHTDFL
jgi:GntR family transcriptional regulator, transcriptional repressor for pyruvate dehydrogenase complex